MESLKLLDRDFVNNIIEQIKTIKFSLSSYINQVNNTLLKKIQESKDIKSNKIININNSKRKFIDNKYEEISISFEDEEV